MSSRFRKLFGRLKIFKNYFFVRKNQRVKLMAYNNKKSYSYESLCEKSDLLYSKSDLSINSEEDYKTHFLQVSSLDNSFGGIKKVTSLDNLSDNNNDNEVDEYKEQLLRMQQYISNNNLFKYGCEREHVIKTQEIKSNKVFYLSMDILNFQGVEHYPDEIAPYYKKDCRTWLWKSVRLARKKRKMQIAAAFNQITDDKTM